MQLMNNFRALSAAEIVLFQFRTRLHVKQNTEIISKLLRNNCIISHDVRNSEVCMSSFQTAVAET